jgi:hypothetical protein
MRELPPQIALDFLHLGQQRGRLSMKPQHVDFAIDALGNGDYRFIHGATGEREFLLKASEKF